MNAGRFDSVDFTYEETDHPNRIILHIEVNEVLWS